MVYLIYKYTRITIFVMNFNHPAWLCNLNITTILLKNRASERKTWVLFGKFYFHFFVSFTDPIASEDAINTMTKYVNPEYSGTV